MISEVNGAGTQAISARSSVPGRASAGTNPILVVLPDGVGVRNFVHSQFIPTVTETSATHLLHAIPENLEERCFQAHSQQFSSGRMLPYQERVLTRFLRSSLAYAQIHWLDSYLIKYLWKRPQSGPWQTRLFTRAARGVGRGAAFPRAIQWLDRMHARVAVHEVAVEQYRRLLEDMRPAVLFCSNQRPTEIVPIVLAARSLGIPTATFIFSWDNLSSKARIAAPFDHFLVWSEHMQGELLKYYPDLDAEQVHIVGTPQFDPYADDDLLWSREEFRSRIGARPDGQLICYSGGDEANAPQDEDHVRILLDQIRTGKIPGNPQVVLRPAPVDPGHRFEQLRQDYPELLYAQPHWWLDDAAHWGQMIPSKDDVQFLANLTHHSDVNVNFASTMALDFAIRDKPVVNIAFDTREPLPYGIPMADLYDRLMHYRPVIEFGATRLARSPGQLAQHVATYLADPSLDREGRARFVKLEVRQPIGESSRRIVDVLNQIRRTLGSTGSD